MPFSPGDRIGPYEILTPLGIGGMGEVFRAYDPRLGRTVALKILSAESARTPEYLKRFEQEARAASSLNHTNVVGVYDIGSHLGLPYFAMELVEGRDLRDLLALGPFELDRALDVAAQMAEGAAAAHARGVVHRDLKPENVMVTPEGAVKLLDFGLAKRVVVLAGTMDETDPGGERLTGEGLIVGTVGYMAPEQARGEPVGPPADQFAIGAIVYELLTGRRAFQKPTAVETLSAILHDDPEEPETPDGPVPPEMHWILGRCLAKDPDLRYASTQDLARELRHFQERRRRASSLQSGPLPAQKPASGPLSAARRGAAGPGDVTEAGGGGVVARRSGGLARRRSPSAALRTARVRAAGLVLCGVLAGAALTFAVGRRGSGSSLPAWTRLTFARGIVRTARFAPDGESVLYSAAWNSEPLRLRLARPGDPDSPALPLPSADLAAVSPSGELAIVLGCRASHGGVCRGTLARAALAGGPPREVTAEVQQADFGPGGDGFVLVREAAGRSRLEYPPGKILYETQGHISYPRLSPSRDLVAFVDHPVPQEERGVVSVVSLAGRKSDLTGMATGVRGLAWSPSGAEVWFTASFQPGRPRNLWAVATKGALGGLGAAGARRLLVSAPAPLTLHDVGRDGRVLLSRDNARTEAHVLAPGATHERDVSWLDASSVRDISADGEFLLVDEESEGLGGEPETSVRRTDGTSAVRLGAAHGLALSPDGRWALVRPARARSSLALVPIGGGAQRLIPQARNVEVEGGRFFPDGRRLLLAGPDGGSGQPSHLFVRDLGEGAPRLVETDPVRAQRTGMALSPDGGTVATLDSAARMVLVPVAGGAFRPIAGSAEDDVPVRFSADGLWLYVYGRRELPASLARIELATGRREAVRSLLPPDPAGVDRIRNVVLSADGRSHAYTASRTLSVLYLATGIR